MDNVNFYGTKEYYERLDELEKTVFSKMNQSVPTKVSKLAEVQYKSIAALSRHILIK